MGKLQENKRRNKASILSAAFKLFASKGYEATTISDIVKGSELARGTFYNYFQDKDEIWDHIVKEFLERVNLRLIEERRNARDIYEFTYNAFMGYALILKEEQMLDLLITNQAIFRRTIFSSGLLNSIYRNLEEDLAQSTFYEGLTPNQIQLTSYSMVGTAIELIFQTYSKDNSLPIEDIGTYFTDLFIGGYERMKSG